MAMYMYRPFILDRTSGVRLHASGVVGTHSDSAACCADLEAVSQLVNFAVAGLAYRLSSRLSPQRASEGDGFVLAALAPLLACGWYRRVAVHAAMSEPWLVPCNE